MKAELPIILAGLCAAGAVRAATWYVDAEAGGAADGASWTDAFTDLQGALAAARSNDQVWVAEGTYRPTNGADRAASFRLPASVALYGGFGGTEALLEERAPASHRTVLSGDIGLPEHDADNSFRVVHAPAGAAGAVLDGFTITRAVSTNAGGGMLIEAPIRVEGCTFEGNRAAFGAGLCNAADSEIRRCVFAGNNASTGGGAVYTLGSSPVLVNCLFYDNWCSRRGGAISARDQEVRIRNCTFVNNIAGVYGRAVYCSNGADVSILNSILWDLGDHGGGVFVKTGPDGALWVDVSHCDVRGGWDPPVGAGGGASNIAADPVFADPFNYDYTLAPESPCIDAGTTQDAPDDDLAGAIRPQGAGVDIGAYEAAPVGPRRKVAVATEPPGLLVRMDGREASAPAEFLVTEGPHTLSAPTPQTDAGVRHVFASWSDGGAASHAVTVTADVSYTAFFATQYQWVVTLKPVGGGLVAPESGSWFDARVSVTGTVSGRWGWVPAGWGGDTGGCDVAGSRIVAPMDRPRALTVALRRADTNLPAGGWRFVVTGDSRGSSALQQVNPVINGEIAARCVAEQAEILILTGDQVMTGSVGSFTDFTNAWAAAYQGGVGVYPVRGNHDMGPGWTQVFDYLPTNGPAGEVGYTFSFGHRNALFIALDHYIRSHRCNQPWLDAQLAANTNRHVFVYGHAPAFALYHKDCLDDYPAERDRFWESLTANRARVYFAGHDHFYDHARIADGDDDLENDLHQYIVGCGGAPFYSDPGAYLGENGRWTPIRQYHEQEYGYVLGEVVSNTVSLLWMCRVASNTYECLEVFQYAVAEPAGEPAIHYVAGGGDHLWPFTNWFGAATNIQAAVEAALDGATVLVSNGTYALDAEVTVAKGITVRGLGGAEATRLDGKGTTRCFVLAHANATVAGFTLTGGYGDTGGGVRVDSPGGTVADCIVSNNQALYDGGGIAAGFGARILNCLLTGNRAGSHGGGLALESGSFAAGCEIRDNEAGVTAGGVWFEDGGRMENGTVVYNTAPAAGGTDHDGGGIIENSILYFNSPTDHNGAPAAGHFAFCCTTPDPGGTGNVTNDPAFASAANARLTAGSACVDGGTNLPGLLPDRDGVPRPLDGDHDGDSVCDIGAYEFIHGAADSDRDGQRDADEIVAGTSPTNAAERFAIDRVFTGSSPAEAWQVAWGTVSGRLYTVLTSTNLLAEWSPAATPGWIDVPGGSAPLWFTNAEPDSPTRFFQIKAVRP